MKNLFLVEPNKKYQKSFENYALTYRRINDELYLNKYKKALENFQDYLNDLAIIPRETTCLRERL